MDLLLYGATEAGQEAGVEAKTVAAEGLVGVVEGGRPREQTSIFSICGKGICSFILVFMVPEMAMPLTTRTSRMILVGSWT